MTGIVVAAFECGIEYQNGRGSIRDTALNVIKGFLAASLFTTVPVELYKLSTSLQGVLQLVLQDWEKILGQLRQGLCSLFRMLLPGKKLLYLEFLVESSISSPIFMIFLLILMGYAVIKVFFANLKRGGILLIQIAVGSLYLFSVPRGYIDGFVGWCKQVIGLCLTAFLQATVLIAGLMVVKDQALLGLGTYVIGRSDSSDCGAVWVGNGNQSKCDGSSLCSAGSYEPNKDGCASGF